LAGLFVAADDEQLRVPGPGDAEQRLGAQQPGAGAGITDQVRPLNCSVRVVIVPLPLWLWPTAQTSLADRAVMAKQPRTAATDDLGRARWTRTRSTPDCIDAGQGLFSLVVAGPGFEPG